MSGAASGGHRLLRAIRTGDTPLVKNLLLRDSDDPDLMDTAFCLAVTTYSGHIAQLLLDHGADPGRCGQEALPSLREAVDSGSPALVEALLDHRIRGRYSRSEFLELRDLARCRHERGVESELRRRTGSQDGLVHTRVPDDEYFSVGAYTLGRTTVRDGHAAILTRFEELLGIRTPFGDLMARALDHDQNHRAWGSATILLARRRDEETWTAAAALRTHPEPSSRLFGAEVLRLTHLFDESEADTFAGPALDLFTAWSTEEEDLAVLTEVLVALGEHTHPRAEAALLGHAGHPDVRVRRVVARGLGTWAGPLAGDVRDALLALLTDTDAQTRRNACLKVAEGRDRGPVLADAMAALLDDADHQVQATAVYGLALHDDERCVRGAQRLPPAPPGTWHAHEHELDAVWRYERRRDGH
ncbi:HEAT repeat domain-containing protein [Streptomyces sp. NPDC094049]|uniref:HEAT repeat domain-containing protein n=1 Tax=Streptomyces sp. NPDC094049 TaxID=3154987 RepID=UPI00332CC024